ncbi:hypothetical protein OsJ_11057 [Oryza sativa Japonica Group]|uniref:Uncharacterized protein n=1 Tax=Oryza sativa subsp. japonica TaxID=39947 RepID=B9F8Q3_ORYSJ|nr:hypothetical protein OsJ_11057 [Oryza sativa Japonica Group]
MPAAPPHVGRSNITLREATRGRRAPAVADVDPAVEVCRRCEDGDMREEKLHRGEEELAGSAEEKLVGMGVGSSHAARRQEPDARAGADPEELVAEVDRLE